MDRIDFIKHGVRASELVDLASRLSTSQERIIKFLGLPRATVVRKSRANENLSTEQAERVVGLAKLVGQVQSMVDQSGDPKGFDAAQWLAQWLERPNAALGGVPPADFMDTVAGQELVGSVLAKMQSGAYA